MKLFRNCILLLITIAFFSFKSQPQKQGEVSELKKQNLVYYFSAPYCPTFANTHKHYGFKMKCTGCGLNSKEKKNNDKVISILNKTYGENWFSNNYEAFFNEAK